MSDSASAHVCVIGSGPAGMVAALELANRGCRVTLVESGFDGPMAAAQELSDAELVFAGRHAPMEDAVHRRWGGTAHLWGGRCVPYDPIDFEPRPEVHEGVWPIDYDALAQYFPVACQYADCGEAGFVAGRESNANSFALSERFVDGDIRSDQLERWSASPVMIHRLGPLIEQHPNVQRLTGRTFIELSVSGDGGAVDGVLLAETLSVERHRMLLACDLVVLACGGVETTRLLLHAGATTGIEIAGAAHLGRNYMGHLSGKIASIRLNGDPKKTLFGFERDGDHYIRRRLTLSDDVLREKKLLNVAMWLDNPPAADPSHRSGILSAAYLAMRAPLIGKRLAPAAIRKAMTKAARPVPLWPHVANLLGHLPSTLSFIAKFFYGRYVAKPRLPGFFVFSGANTYALHYHAEQSPNAESCVTLSDQVDSLGVPRAKIALQFNARDAESVVAAHGVLDEHLRAHGIGQLDYWYPDENRLEAVLSQARDGFHQIGTIRMGVSKESGVTDAYGQVFGVANLFVCSSAVFPTSGQANPTLTLLAFAVRQARHIAERRSSLNAER